jgi:hypothetical protein
VLNGSLSLLHGPYTIFSVDASSGDVSTEGTITARGSARLVAAVTVDAPLDVAENVTVHRGLGVSDYVVLNEALSIQGDVNVDDQLHMNGGMVVAQDVWIGASGESELLIRGDLVVQNVSGGTKVRANSTGAVYVGGLLRVLGELTVSNSVDLGAIWSDTVTVNLRSVMRRDMQALDDVDVAGALSCAGAIELGSAFGTHGSGDLMVFDSVQLGRSYGHQCGRRGQGLGEKPDGKCLRAGSTRRAWEYRREGPPHDARVHRAEDRGGSHQQEGWRGRAHARGRALS